MHGETLTVWASSSPRSLQRQLVNPSSGQRTIPASGFLVGDGKIRDLVGRF